ncbi:hypothetical protein ES319_D04G110800v1 [Gossypium barbadense]|uniref:Uncharacterized protein n=1 Tax=Gossypium barbadense TaxID=3634 RepID=A0A5J5RUT1_GOSBA|nr:hypothetical protein ES319_D04G110800v1 [Gossypium barbadense]
MQLWGSTGAATTRLDVENPVPDLRESSNNNPMVIRRIQLQETVEKLSQIIFRIYLFLQYHLQHGVPEVQIRVVGVFLHR